MHVIHFRYGKNLIIKVYILEQCAAHVLSCHLPPQMYSTGPAWTNSLVRCPRQQLPRVTVVRRVGVAYFPVPTLLRQLPIVYDNDLLRSTGPELVSVSLWLVILFISLSLSNSTLFSRFLTFSLFFFIQLFNNLVNFICLIYFSPLFSYYFLFDKYFL